MAIKLILGLGNPGPSYTDTRHNAGAWFVQALCQTEATTLAEDKKMQARLAKVEHAESFVTLAIPITFMNHSGQPARIISQFYRLTVEEILVIHDELDLPPGTIRLKTGGGHGGHNGLRDIISHLGSPNFHRLRMGIGHPGHRDLVHSYVLQKPSISDKQAIMAAIDRGLSVMPLIITGEIANAMNQLNQI